MANFSSIPGGTQLNPGQTVRRKPDDTGFEGYKVPTTGSDVGLGNVDNTSDANKPISTATQTALNAKQNTITAGTTGDYYRGDKTFQTLDKSAVGLGNVDNTSDSNKPISAATQSALNDKADTTYVDSELSDKVDTSSLSDVAFSGEYDDLLSKPTLGTAAATDSTDYATASQGAKADTAVQPASLSTVATTGAYSDLSGKPTLGTAAATNSTAYATSAQGAKADTAVQPGSLATVATTGVYNDLSGKPTLGTAASTSASAYATSAQGAKADTAVQPGSLATVATTGSYNDLSSKPTIPTVKRIETYTGTTDGSGNFTVTYSPAFSVTPDVQPQLQAGTASQVVRITSSTSTGFTVQVTNRSSATVLGIELLLASTTPVSGSSLGVLVVQR